MRIAHVTATFPPYWAGTGNVAYHDARILHERGHDVTVFTAAPRLAGGEAELPRFPFRVAYLPVRLRIGNAPLTPSLAAHLRGFDLIHLHYPYIFGAELTALAARRYWTPLVITYHNDLLAPGPRGAIFSAYRRTVQPWVLDHARRLIATSLDYAGHSDLRPWTPDAGRVAEVPNGVDTSLFRPADRPDRTLLARYGVPGDGPVVLFVGALDSAHHFKGVPVLLEALAGLPGVHAVLAGDGDLRPSLEARGRDLLGDRAHFAGRIDLRTLVGLYQAADVTVLPSVTRGEAFGMVLIESMACGTPVVASDLAGVRSVVRDGEDGLLVPAGEARALADALARLLADPGRRAAMGRRGRDKAERRYDWQVVGHHLDAVYRDALAATAEAGGSSGRDGAGGRRVGVPGGFSRGLRKTPGGADPDGAWNLGSAAAHRQAASGAARRGGEA